MKKLEKTSTIKFTFWRADGKDISPKHVISLEETAMEQIQDCIQQGFTSGRLDTTLAINGKEFAYNGSWSVKDS